MEQSAKLEKGVQVAVHLARVLGARRKEGVGLQPMAGTVTEPVQNKTGGETRLPYNKRGKVRFPHQPSVQAVHRYPARL